MSKFAAFLAGIRAQAPILLGIIPFGLIYGIAAMEAGLPSAVAIGMSVIVFAGSSQFIAAQLFASGTPGLIIILTTFIVNLRHMLYSASLAPYTRHLPRRWKFILPFGLTDEVYAVVITHYRRQDPAALRGGLDHWFFLGAGFTLWSSWVSSSVVGVLLGASVPAGWSLDFALALTFIALLIPTLEDRPTIAAALLAGLTAVAASGLRYNLGLVLAVLVGIGAGVLAERLERAAPVEAAEPQGGAR
ncbi:MAG: AzlC family ABC transporter permease [Anaerolineae bacterium]|nr:AzlC family ABC transporter permease [Anaerolineae bacterium]